MSQHKFAQKILPKFVDSDTEVRYIKTDNGAVSYMSNIRIGKRTDKTKGACTNIKGTLLVPNNYLPSGTNECLGAISNETNRFLIFFNWNSNNEHGVYLYNPTFEEPIKLLYKDSHGNITLGFHRYFKIKGTKAKIIQDKHLFWTDFYNAPRYLNIEWALDHNKKKVFEIQQVDEDIVDFNVFKFKYKGNIIDVYLGNLGTVLTSNPLLSNYFDIEDCSCSIILTEKEPNTCELISISNKIRIVPQNFYTNTHHERQIDLVCYPPSIAPKVVLRKDLKQRKNLLSGNTWQFRTKNIYFDNNESAWSAWSKLVNTSGGCEEEYNYVRIDYTDTVFNCYNDINQLHLIKAVVIGYRNTNQGNLHSFVTVNQCDIPKGTQFYDFYNDTSAGLEPEYDDKLKQYDIVPLQCGTLSASGNRLLVGDVTENYEEDCFDFDVEVDYHPKEDIDQFKGKIECWIDIKNFNIPSQYNLPITQQTENADTYNYGLFDDYDRFDERLGTKGFTVYLAGTDHKTITKQVISGANSLSITDDEYNIVDNIGGRNTETIINAIKNEPAKFRQKATITGIKDGTYIIRIASHWCSYNNKLGKGEAYDLDNGIIWQKTSTNVLSVNNIKNIFEAKVTVVNGVMVEPLPVFNVQTASGIAESSRIYLNIFGFGIGITYSLIQGYVIDSNSVAQEDVYQGTRVEHAVIKTVKVGEFIHTERGSPTYALTDHNGYGFLIARVGINDIGGNNKINVSKGRNINWDNLPGNDGDMAILWDDNNPFDGNLTQLKNGSCDTFNNEDDNFSQEVVNNFIFPYLADAHNVTNNFRTLIKGRIATTQDNYPLSNVLVVATGTNRFDKTDVNGEFGIIVYANSDTRSDFRTVDLIFSGDDCNNINATFRYTIDLGKIPPKHNNTNPYDIGTIFIDVTYNDLTPTYYLKNGDTYEVGVTLMDRALRKTTVLHNDKKHKIRLPFTTEYIQDYFPTITKDTLGNSITPTTKAEGFFTLRIKPITKPPIWCTHIYFLRTEGQIYADYVQMVVSDVKYVINYKETLNETTGAMDPTPVTTTYENKDANEIYLDLISSFSEYKDRNSSSKKGWTFEKGDRLRFIYNEEGVLYDFIEVEIKEQRGNYFVIDNIDALNELKLGFVVELFRFKTKVTDKRYFEIAEHIKVIDAYLPTREWELNQLELNTGDAYRRIRRMIAKNENERIPATRLIEDPTPDDSLLEKDNDIGRSDFINRQYKQIRRLGTIRCGDTILTDSNINNIRRFDAEQQFTSNNNYGAITAIDDFKNVIFVAQQSKCHTRYIGRSSLRIGNGDVALSDPKTILSEPDYLADDYGCLNPESYARCGNFGFFYDATKGVVAAYFTQNGLNSLSGYDDRYQSSKLQDSIFKNLSDSLNKIPMELYPFLVQIQSVFNDKENEVNISVRDINISKGQDISEFSGTALKYNIKTSNIGDNDVKFKVYEKSEIDFDLSGFTMCYDNEIKMWLLNRSYNPTAYGMVNSNFIGFIGGAFHLMEHGNENSYNNFFGTKYKSVLGIVMNEEPSMLKVFKNWSIESNKKWSNPFVKVYNSRAFRDIKSRTSDAKIEKRQGVFYAPFMFDVNTPNVANPLISGNPLVGETLLLRLENDDTTEVVLYAVNIYADYVARSNY